MLFAVTDIETTGSYASGNSITEIAVCLHDGTHIVREFHSLVDPGKPIPPYIKVLTGITDEMLEGAPTFSAIADDIMSITEGAVFVAHNVNFDYSFIRAEFLELGIDWKPKKLCTMRLAKKAFPLLPRFGLGRLCVSLGITNEAPHRALGDARAAAEVFEQSIKVLDDDVISKMISRGSGEAFLPAHIEAESYHALPETPGVYYFLNTKGKPIYIGKAINIKKRVRSHFNGDLSSEKLQGFIREIHRIDFRQTGNELIALLLEDAEIRRHWPAYNRAQKHRTGKFGVFLYNDQKGYMRLAVNNAGNTVNALATFHSGHAARNWMIKLADEHELDKRIIGIQLNEDAWPDINEHNEKLQQAIDNTFHARKSCVLYSFGRSQDEYSFVMVEKGRLKGFGFVPSGEQVTHADELENWLELIPGTETNSAIIRSYMENPRGMRLVEW